MKDSKEKEHRISNLKDMINNVKDEEEVHEFDDIDEDYELISYLNENSQSDEELEIDDEFIYHPGDEDSNPINLEESPIDDDFIIQTPNVDESSNEDEEDEELGDEISGEISEGFDNLVNAKIGRTPIVGIVSVIIGLIGIVLAGMELASRSEKIVDNVAAGETTFIAVIYGIFGLLLLGYGIYRIFGLSNPLEKISLDINNITDDEDSQEMEKEDDTIIPKSNIPLDKESYKIGEYKFDDLKNSLKKPKSSSEPKTTPTEENIDDIPPAREKPPEQKGWTRDDIDEMEHDQAILDNESIDEIFAEVEDLEDIPIISVDSKEEK